MLCKGDMVMLERCGYNDKPRVARVEYANDTEFTPVVRWLGFMPIWVLVRGIWWISEEGKTWHKLPPKTPHLKKDP